MAPTSPSTSSADATDIPATTRAVIMDHDGSLDDLLSLLLLARYRSVDLLGVAITPADCLIAPAVAATRRILELTGRDHVATAAGTLTGPNPFPVAWRTDAQRVAALPVLNRTTHTTTPAPRSPSCSRSTKCGATS